MEKQDTQTDLGRLRIDRQAWGAGPVPGRRRRRWLLWAALAALLALAAGVAGWRGGYLRPAREVKVATVSRLSPGMSLAVLGATGYVVAQRKAAVSSKGTGRLAYMGVEAGQTVKQGQVLARLENDDLTAARDEAQSRVAAARAEVERNLAELGDAQLNFARIQALLARKVSPKADFDVAQARLLKARAGVNSARRQVDVAMALARQMQASLDYTYIRAPFDAVVLTKDADVGEVVAPFGGATSAKAAVATLADMDSLMVEADVTESNIGKVRVDQPCQISLDALPDTPLLGSVHVILPTADRSKGTIIVKVKFQQLDPRVLPEMSAKVSFLSRPLTSQELEPRLSLPAQALVKQGDQTLAWRLLGERLDLTTIKTGPALGDSLQVLEGLQEGDRVVLDPAPGLKPGDKVKVAAP
ncbi:MAG: efflux RND transporter periplasmic adaptor subunit [Pseudomonadota bacterium]